MSCHPSRAVDSYSSGPPTARYARTTSIGGFTIQNCHPVACTILTAHDGPGGRSDGVWEPLEGEPGPVGAVLLGYNSVDIWNLRLEFGRKLRQGLRTHLGMHFLAVG